MDKRVSGLLDLAEALKLNPPATTYPDMPLRVALDYPSRDAAVEAAAQYGATVRQSGRKHFQAVREFATEPGEFFAGAQLEVWWSR